MVTLTLPFDPSSNEEDSEEFLAHPANCGWTRCPTTLL